MESEAVVVVGERAMAKLAAGLGKGPEHAGPPRARPTFAPPEETQPDLAVDRYRPALEGVPKRFRGHRLETVGPRLRRPQALEEIRSALEELLRGDVLALTLVGGSEAGKTSLAAALYAALVDLAIVGNSNARRLLRAPLWTDALALARARRGYKLGDGEAPLVDRAVHASLTVLDDLGQDTAADSDEAIEVIWRRWQEERPTIVTTGQPPQKLRDRYGNGVWTRLTKQSESRVILCEEASAEKPTAQTSLPIGGSQ